MPPWFMRKKGAGQTETFCFQIEHCSILAKTNCYCEKCSTKSPPVKWRAWVFSNPKPSSGFQPETHSDPVAGIRLRFPHGHTGVVFSLASLTPNKNQTSLCTPWTGIQQGLVARRTQSSALNRREKRTPPQPQPSDFKRNHNYTALCIYTRL